MSCPNRIGTSRNRFAATSSGENHARPSRFGAIAEALPQSDMRMDKVTVLQLAIANGTYSVPASDVADKIIQSLLM